jgi:hypothetical protein
LIDFERLVGTHAIGWKKAGFFSAAFSCAHRKVAMSIDLPGLAGRAYKVSSTAFPSF